MVDPRPGSTGLPFHGTACDQRDSAFCALQPTALIKPKRCVLLYCCACLHPNTILMQAGWTTVPYPTTDLSVLICKSSARTKQTVMSVALKIHLEIRLGICIYKTTSGSTQWLYWVHTELSPHILQQNCALVREYVINSSHQLVTGEGMCCHHSSSYSMWIG